MTRLALLAVTFALAAAACGGGGTRAVSSGPASGEIVDGSPERFAEELSDMRGRPVVVNFWATWCDPCKEEMPRLVAAAERYDGDVRFLGIDVQDDPTAARRFVADFSVPFRSLADPKRDIVRSQKILGLPVTQFYASDGELTFVHSGEISAEELEEKIGELLRVSRATPR